MIEGTAQSLQRLRASSPLVQLITNFVSMNLAANTLIAIGASPAMVQAPEEAADFIQSSADALTVNIGTLLATSAQAMQEAATAANNSGKPWVFDPVAVNASQFRRDLGARLLSLSPTIIRGNASEIRALANPNWRSARGVDASDSVSKAESSARELAHKTGAVIAMTGPMDFITDGNRSARVFGGHDLMPKVTALGCALSGVTAAFAAVAPPFDAAVAALSSYGTAGWIAGQRTWGPGSFACCFIDALYGLTPEMICDHTRIELI